ncbi:hypothetical protein EVAR_44593_1 [Eumeta japonica]|uniref:Uncharacterized protein n=1 Tax=Eumeta variegata TaxID=151549 RepID=A0A4C1X8S7_EUMVA|nr:hypothetical protein EVAR_44593_1 [Eumeta japonica]
MFDFYIPKQALGIGVQFTMEPGASPDFLADEAPLGDPYNPRRTVLMLIRPAHLPPWGLPIELPSVTCSMGCRLLRNLTARSSRLPRCRAELSVDRGFRGAARPRIS